MTAITEVTTCVLPVAQPGSALAEAYARSAALHEHYLLCQITRLGRLSAYKRVADWLLETQARLAMAGVPTVDQFLVPLTQELLADALGLTSVHVNRTLQALRRDELITWQAGLASVLDRRRLEKLADHKPPRISAER